MLRIIENIWSKSLVNSEEFAMFAVPNHYTTGLLYIYFHRNRNIAGFLEFILPFWLYSGLATNERGSASSFIKNIINQIFSNSMPNRTENLKPGDNSTLTSTQPSEKGKSQLQKLLQSALKKADEKEAECKTHEAEKYRLLCYIDRYCSCLLSNFLENNPLESRDWKKLHRQQLDIREAIK